MYTLVDFVTHIKGVEYLVSITAITGFLLLWEVLKARPFRTVAAAGKEDLEYLGQVGYGTVFRTIGRIAAAPVIGLAYLVMIPVGFAAALATALAELAARGISAVLRATGSTITFEWRPLTAYFAGKRKRTQKR